MTKRRTVVVVDGSNLATEGRTAPSLRQLDESVAAFLEERPDSDMVVVVDATFEHRVAPAERERVKEAELKGAIVTPPAGAIGRGDAFILKIAKRADAVVLSNDSFQEFHAEHPWLFEEGRLIGGKPVPRVGWIFTPRTPVRGQKSKAVTKKAARAEAASQEPAPSIGDVLPAPRTRSRKASVAAAPRTPTAPAPAAVAKRGATKAASRGAGGEAAPAKASQGPPKGPSKTTAAKAPAQRAPAQKVAARKGAAQRSAGQRGTGQRAPAQRDAARATVVGAHEAPPRGPARKAPAEKDVAPRGTKRNAPAEPAKRAPKAQAAPPTDGTGKARPEQINTQRSFLRLVAEHDVGGTVEGEVVQFTSHGAMVSVAAGRRMQVVCYAPLAGLGSPPPTRARDVLKKGEVHRFRIVSFDETRRRAELALASP